MIPSLNLVNTNYQLPFTQQEKNNKLMNNASANNNSSQGLTAYPKAYYVQKNQKQVAFGAGYDIEWAHNWDREKRTKQLIKRVERDVKNLSWWARNFTSKPEIIVENASETLENEQNLVTNLLKNAGPKLKEIKEEQEKYGNLKTASEINEKFGENLDDKIDSKIAGYGAEKSILRNKFIQQVALDKADLTADVPKAILFYGCIGTGKTTFAQAVAAESGCHLEEINPDPNQFAEVVHQLIDESKERYNNTGQRTVILINEIERHLCEQEENKINISLMKNALDNCSNKPNDSQKTACGATFFFTTNHPMDVTDEILLRRGKLGHVVPLEPADGENMKEVLKHYIKKADPEKKEFDYEKDFNYDEMTETLKPSLEKGAYSNDKLRLIVQKAYESYNLNKENSFQDHLEQKIEKAKPDIRPIRLQHYYQDLKELDEE